MVFCGVCNDETPNWRTLIGLAGQQTRLGKTFYGINQVKDYLVQNLRRELTCESSTICRMFSFLRALLFSGVLSFSSDSR